MKNSLIVAILLGLVLSSCNKEKDPFLISNGSIGPLSKKIQMKQVDSVFAQDSIVALSSIENALGTQGEVEVYEKGGNKLLLLSPNKETDPNSVITNIQVFDERYKTNKGLHVNSTFADLKANYTIQDIETTISSVVIFLKDSDIYITIDKKELPENVRYNPNIRIEQSQIPDTATFKFFMIGWDAEDTPDQD